MHPDHDKKKTTPNRRTHPIKVDSLHRSAFPQDETAVGESQPLMDATEPEACAVAEAVPASEEEGHAAVKESVPGALEEASLLSSKDACPIPPCLRESVPGSSTDNVEYKKKVSSDSKDDGPLSSGCKKGSARRSSRVSKDDLLPSSTPRTSTKSGGVVPEKLAEALPGSGASSASLQQVLASIAEPQTESPTAGCAVGKRKDVIESATPKPKLRRCNNIPELSPDKQQSLVAPDGFIPHLPTGPHAISKRMKEPLLP